MGFAGRKICALHNLRPEVSKKTRAKRGRGWQKAQNQSVLRAAPGGRTLPSYRMPNAFDRLGACLKTPKNTIPAFFALFRSSEFLTWLYEACGFFAKTSGKSHLNCGFFPFQTHSGALPNPANAKIAHILAALAACGHVRPGKRPCLAGFLITLAPC